MAALIRFKLVEIDSNIIFNGRTKRTLNYPVRSVSLVSLTKPPWKLRGLDSLPEIFLQ